MTSSPSIRVFVVEDHPIVRDGYTLVLGAEADMMVCGYASNEVEAVIGVAESFPDVVIVDLVLEDGSSGLQLIHQLSQLHSQLRMLVISGSDESLFARRAIDVGACGYLNKRSASGNLINAIRRVIAGEVVLSAAIASQMLKTRSDGTRHTGSGFLSLTNREVQVFQMIGEGHGTSQMAELLFLSPRTVERHRENIKRKLKLANSTELVRHATQWNIENR